MMSFINWLSNLFCKAPQEHEEFNVVASIAKAKSLHKKLIVIAHPDRHLDKVELATELSTLINKNKFNYNELVKLQERVDKELIGDNKNDVF